MKEQKDKCKNYKTEIITIVNLIEDKATLIKILDFVRILFLK